ncbi:laminin subunit gamma-3 [Elysia marginata]|uniref:Laminin subunit gamma-3 n=1 Tax=Elysia marginata TaxID=1093978 RepID=A0AAV4J1X4_9GAST|nr:laminin subunit gamma-3 [Elysia marginata]
MLVKVVFFILGLQTVLCQVPGTSRPCYDSFGAPQRCQPPFVNPAYGRVFKVTNTCGVGRETEYCVQTGRKGVGQRKYCNICDDRDPRRRHPPEYLSDFNNNTITRQKTWWQSDTMLEGMQYPTQINITLHLEKAFDITYVNLRFYSPRPESFAIYKRTSQDGEWIPYQFYSASCRMTYNQPRDPVITRANEDQAFCTADYAGISPLTGGTVAFSTLEGRPSMFNFNHSPKLQEWVTATDLRVVLTRMNTFGDEVFGDPQVLKSYFYAISDLSVGARCKCNGHASSCVKVRDQDLDDRLRCRCEHNTMGVDCEMCKPFYNDRPWGRATERDANECKACDCNGLSNTCEFDEELYRTTGHGGRCTNCRDNTDGIHCEICKENFWRSGDKCLDCGCNEIGSVMQQCSDRGECRCKPGVGGKYCDRCLPNFYDFSETGCIPCQCDPSGSLDNNPRCDATTGKCECKENVDGRRCDKCKPGFFGLNPEDPFGCTSCFCYGHSSDCSSASGYYVRNITSNFNTGNQGWTAVTRSGQEVATQYNGVTGNLGVKSDSEPVYFLAPASYLGDQRYSYNQYLTFDMRTGGQSGQASRSDVILEGGNGQSVKLHIWAQNNNMPRTISETLTFRLHEDPKFNWLPTVNAVDFISVLSNLTAIKIRGTYSENGVGFIDDVTLVSAVQGRVGNQQEAPWVEQCKCPEGFIGQFCQDCQQGYKRNPPNSNSFGQCVPCECNGHSESCDIQTGRCICQDNTAGDFCEVCARGYYGDATNGSSSDCKKCPCPNDGPCIELSNGDLVCTECEEGYAGNLCEVCLDGYFGDPNGILTGQATPCTKCFCNGNIDPNAIGNCDMVTGECRKCIRNTAGRYCDKCLPSYYNNTEGQCTACNCYHAGTDIRSGGNGCDQSTGQCYCRPYVKGKQCDRCEPGFYDLASGEGCKPCDCDRTGSYNYTCDVDSGQCRCKPGVTGLQCNECDRFYYGLSAEGCTACNCDPVGSTDLTCDDYGRCYCKENVAGRRCDRCEENKFNIAAGCIDCPQCYNLVQRQVNNHRAKLRELTALIEHTTDNPSLFNDTNFINQLQAMNESVNYLLEDARGAYTGDGKVGQQLDILRDTLNDLIKKLTVIASNIATAANATENSETKIKYAEEALAVTDRVYQKAKDYIDKEGRNALNQALKALEDFGQNSKQMTEIARRASSLAANQTEEAEVIKNLARKALSTSEMANQMARETFRMPGETQQEIQRLNRDYEDASSLFDSTKQRANSTFQRAKMAYDKALELLTQADKELPSLDVDALKEEAMKIKEQAEDIMMRAQKLSKENMELMERVRNQTKAANMLLEDGDLINNNITELLSEADYARDVARKAVESAKNTLKEANDTLTTLEEFDKLVSKKDAAEQAMQEVPEIKKIIEEAKNTTLMAREALSGVDADAKRALELAKEAEETANMASKNAGNIRKEAEETKNKADMLHQDAMNLAQKVEDADAAMGGFENQLVSDENSAQKALSEAAEAKNIAQDAFDEVTKSHALVLKIKESLKDMGSVDMQQLQDLEALLDKVEKDMMEADVESKVRELQARKTKIETQADKFESNLSQLYEDVENIREIQDSLPTGCYKTIPIEQPLIG